MKHPLKIATAVAALLLCVAAGAGQAASLAAPTNTAAPTVAGSAAVGQTLSANDGSWANNPTSFSYQWLRCNGGGNNCAPISGASQKTYVVATADVGHTLRIRVTAKNADGSASADSAQTAAVASPAPSSAPKNTAAPTISGTPRVGQTLTADPGSWSGNPTSYGYQWQRCDIDATASCVNVTGATLKTYVLHSGDIGFRIRVRVTARNDKGSTTATSTATAVVSPAARIVNRRPTLTILSVRFLGQTIYSRFRVCDDSMKNVTIIETDSRPGKLSYTRRFTTLVPPRPCGVYTRHWTPAARFRGPGRYTLTLKARDKSGFTSVPASRTFNHG